MEVMRSVGYPTATLLCVNGEMRTNDPALQIANEVIHRRVQDMD